LKIRLFRLTRRAAAETWLDRPPSELFLGGLQKFNQLTK
jgi:hypothetical protein